MNPMSLENRDMDSFCRFLLGTGPNPLVHVFTPDYMLATIANLCPSLRQLKIGYLECYGTPLAWNSKATEHISATVCQLSHLANFWNLVGPELNGQAILHPSQLRSLVFLELYVHFPCTSKFDLKFDATSGRMQLLPLMKCPLTSNVKWVVNDVPSTEDIRSLLERLHYVRARRMLWSISRSFTKHLSIRLFVLSGQPRAGKDGLAASARTFLGSQDRRL
ncbi:hypothetical protein BJ138DRAFT_1161550 [Hygrophoropsis aurantiaca]|uniref:Uncharacterized protein n=1 Tax=Hygrophoropsis aurantiaca TaxID=72124 RepID=A0ACB8A138_9AGAM|nr:hypothetical protein BJ138DRAFT_1161550 [Hygrophoropsis aurantiaca]